MVQDFEGVRAHLGDRFRPVRKAGRVGDVQQWFVRQLVEDGARDREPADALMQVAEEIGASTIVVGNKGMSGGRRLLGSVPNKVSHEAHCNVLIVATS